MMAQAARLVVNGFTLAFKIILQPRDSNCANGNWETSHMDRICVGPSISPQISVSMGCFVYRQAIGANAVQGFRRMALGSGLGNRLGDTGNLTLSDTCWYAELD